MKGNTEQGFVFKNRSFVQGDVESVPSAVNLTGQTGTGFQNSKKSSETAAFGASRKCGSVKGDC